MLIRAQTGDIYNLQDMERIYCETTANGETTVCAAVKGKAETLILARCKSEQEADSAVERLMSSSGNYNFGASSNAGLGIKR